MALESIKPYITIIMNYDMFALHLNSDLCVSRVHWALLLHINYIICHLQYPSKNGLQGSPPLVS